jgi:hypothetical protein
MTRRGLPVQTLAGLAIGAALAVAVLVGVAAPGIVHAQILKCEIRTLQPNDERRLVASARSTFPPGLQAFVTHPCRNGGSAIAGVVTEHLKESNGVLHWWELSCRRETEDWKCDPADFKQFVSTTLLIRGRPRRVAISFGKVATLSQVRQLSSDAINLYLDPASHVRSCSSDVIESRWAIIRAREKLPGPKKPIYVAVSVDGDVNSVMLSDINMEIRLPRSSVNVSNPATACFYELVIVT